MHVFAHCINVFLVVMTITSPPNWWVHTCLVTMTTGGDCGLMGLVLIEATWSPSHVCESLGSDTCRPRHRHGGYQASVWCMLYSAAVVGISKAAMLRYCSLIWRGQLTRLDLFSA